MIRQYRKYIFLLLVLIISTSIYLFNRQGRELKEIKLKVIADTNKLKLQKLQEKHKNTKKELRDAKKDHQSSLDKYYQYRNSRGRSK
ncbi:MAG: hypothetical protein GTN36_05550 [Candidatus Aenigmarchaeota archaeon]|nr:hypothetical protein [Candidatus Aenigmarchaeota archaeon]